MAIGYACIMLGSPEISLKSCTLRYATEERLRHITLHNIWALSDMIDYNIRNGIQLFRISSDLIPFGSHPVNRLAWWTDYGELLAGIGSKIREAGIRISMHPGQYTVLNSPDPGVVERSITDLEYHVRVLESLGAGVSHKIILHVGGVYGNKELSASRFIQNVNALPDRIKNRLVLENDEKSYHIEDVLSLSKNISLPAVFDNLHHSLNAPDTGKPEQPAGNNEDAVRWINRCGRTWMPADGRQKIHYAQQQPGGKPGAHSQSIDVAEFAKFYSALSGYDVDIMLEVKDKNISALNCIHAVEGRSIST